MTREILAFERRHLIAIMLFIHDCGGRTTRMALYRNVANNEFMPSKLEILEGHDLIIQKEERVTKAMQIELTEKGRQVAERLLEIDRIIGSFNAPTRKGRY